MWSAIAAVVVWRLTPDMHADIAAETLRVVVTKVLETLIYAGWKDEVAWFVPDGGRLGCGV